MALRTLGKPGIDSRQGAIITGMYRRTSLAPQVNEGFGVRDEVIGVMAPEMGRDVQRGAAAQVLLAALGRSERDFLQQVVTACLLSRENAGSETQQTPEKSPALKFGTFQCTPWFHNKSLWIIIEPKTRR